MDVLLGLGLLLLGALLLALAWVLAMDPAGFGSRVATFSATVSGAFGNRYWVGRERGLRRFYAFIITVVALGAILGGLERIFGFGPR